MAAPTHDDVLARSIGDNTEPWTEERFLALPANRCVELLDGALLVSPSPGGPHQRLSFRICYLLERARPDDVEALESVNVRVGPGKILIPDLAVVRGSGDGNTTWDAADVTLAVEILGPNTRSAHRTVKTGLYAAAGIAHHLEIELGPDGPDATLHRLEGGRYREIARARPGEELTLIEPVALTVDLAALLAAPRLPG
ncbi:MAG: Uma2 family endonuclease [Pseudonocardia sp.]|nr:Uma2 family endonuclease [Pseudonocardia sp.]